MGAPVLEPRWASQALRICGVFWYLVFMATSWLSFSHSVNAWRLNLVVGPIRVSVLLLVERVSADVWCFAPLLRLYPCIKAPM